MKVNTNEYPSEVLYKCFYWYGANFDVTIEPMGESCTQITLKHKHESLSDDDIEKLISKIKRDIIDFKLRQIVTNETKTVRELLIAKAFAYYGLDDNPLTNVSDPVGFNPSIVNPHDPTRASDN